MSVHTIQQNQHQNNRLNNPVLESMSSAVMTGANNAIARAALTGVFKAIDNLTREQDSFLNSLDRKKEVEKDKFSSFSEVVGSIPLSAFCSAFPNFNTPGALEIVKASRDKLGIQDNSNL